MNYYEFQPKLELILTLAIGMLLIVQLKCDQLEKWIFGDYYFAIRAKREMLEINDKIELLKSEFNAIKKINTVALCCLGRNKLNTKLEQLQLRQIGIIQTWCNEHRIFMLMNAHNLNIWPGIRM